MALKMRFLYYSSKAKMKNIAEAVKAEFDLAQNFNAIDIIPPAYSCDKERLVIMGLSVGNEPTDQLRLFCRELTKARAQNVALMIDGDTAAANKLKEILTEAGTNVIDEVLYINVPLFGSAIKPEEKTEIFAWIDRVIANLK